MNLIKLELTYLGNEMTPVNRGEFARTVVVPSGFSMAFLHEVIQTAFNWRSYHLYYFQKGNTCYSIPEGDAGFVKGDKLAPKTSISSVFKKLGDVCRYVYDLGDENNVEVAYVGDASEYCECDFNATGSDLIDDSMMLGYTPGILKLLSLKGSSPEKKRCVKWLSDYFGLKPKDVKSVPSSQEIALRVLSLVNLVESSIP